MGIISLIKPLKKYQDYFYKANTYENLYLRKKAIDIMKTAIQQKHFNKREISSGLFYLGILYSKSKEYNLASDSYHNGLEMVINENFYYSSNFKNAIETFLKNNDTERAKFWLNNLLERQSYDKNFKKLNKLKNIVE
ncbi:hypothetical protein [Neobacillus sp. SuZ13]|uniref:hypothetical protein n=1 Tax=Neobacillus sp. SuZ13 TaxID=3047875 RepID=UPI0024C02653|nr:hypothetical protein [Neobacillus sp. SuZ13]WHY69375.1 hypothetical protein QNH17_12335 [Neobacillus sp. SuZ13]